MPRLFLIAAISFLFSSATGALAQTNDECSNTKTWRSIESKSPLTIKFSNDSGQSVNIYWINFSGQRQFFKNLQAGKQFVQQSFRTHPWVVTDLAGTCMRALVATSSTTVVISRLTNDYSFGRANLATEYWVGNKKVFTSPVGVDVEFEVVGDFYWLIADRNGHVVKSVLRKWNAGSWTSIDLPSLGLFGNFAIGFRNATNKNLVIKQGVVRQK